MVLRKRAYGRPGRDVVPASFFRAAAVVLPAGASAPVSAGCRALTEHDVREVALSHSPKKIKDFSSTPQMGRPASQAAHCFISNKQSRHRLLAAPQRGLLPRALCLHLQLSINEPALENAGS